MVSTKSDTERFLENNSRHLKRMRMSKTGRIAFLFPGLRKLYNDYSDTETTEQRALACAKVLNVYEESFIWRTRHLFWILTENIRVLRQQKGFRNRTIDHSDKTSKDYYSVVVIVKNEARYIREFILFYKATGADRIYIYDNDSTDALLDVLRPFLESGLVVYRYLHGPDVQTFAYRDAVRRTKHRTKWLAVIDADEFLFSPRGRMPEQLRAYEEYPGVGVNWVMFGPCGQKTRPEGLIEDNYTETYADKDIEVNHHIKSIVQPSKVFSFFHTHFPIYKGRLYAVNENGDTIDNYCAYSEGAGRAFTENNNREIFRINHYFTKSLEELKEKCERGYADGAPGRKYEEVLQMFDAPLIRDCTIKPYADLIREEYYCL